MVGDKLLSDLRKAKNVVIPAGVLEIRDFWFMNSNIESVTIPKSVRKIGFDAFYQCDHLERIYVEDRCEAGFCSTGVTDPTKIFPQPETMVGSMRVWDLRERKDVVIPGGVERIGNHWFWGSGVESVTIPASVREIEIEAFCQCRRLKKVIFAEGSRLERIGVACFCGSGIEELAFPSALKELGADAFYNCNSLKTIRMEREHEVNLMNAGLSDSV